MPFLIRNILNDMKRFLSHMPHFNSKPVSKLSWGDFKGTPEENSPYDACLKWGIYYNYKFNRSSGLIQLDVNVKSIESSWFRKGKETEDLLVHERGHYVIAAVYGSLFKNTIEAIHFPNEFHVEKEISRNFDEIFNNCLQMQDVYDEETNHSLNTEMQKRWNDVLFLNHV